MMIKRMVIWMIKVRAWLAKKLIKVALWLLNNGHLNLSQKLLQFIRVQLLGGEPLHFCKWQIREVNGVECLVCKDCGKVFRDNGAA
jgi:hypothetical protein